MFLERHAGVVGAVKVIGTLIAVPILLWLLTVFQEDRDRRRSYAEARLAEVGEALPAIQTAQALLYEACLGVTGGECAARVEEALGGYLTAEHVFSGTIERYFPDLTPTTQLLASLDDLVSSDVSYLWRDYLACLEAPESEALSYQASSSERIDWCAERRRSYPIRGLAVSDFVIEYLDCKVQMELSAKLETESSEFCQAVVEAREDACLERPASILSTYDGLRLPSELFEVQNAIWCKFILPGSGLGDESC